jgi:hypothetical protein
MRNGLFSLKAAVAAGNIALANDQSLFYPSFDGNVAFPHGTVQAANDANFDAQFLAQPLQDYIVGAPEDEGIQAILDAICPSIPVARSFTYRVHDTAEQFQDDSDSDADIREIGGDFAQVKRTGTQAEGRTDNKGLVMILDNDQGGEDQRVQERAVVNLRSRLLRSELRRAIAVLDAGATNTASNWGPSAVKPDPDMDMLTDVDAGGDARGVDSNIVILGGGARIKRKKCFRSQLTSGSNASAAMSDSELADMLGVNRVVTIRNRRQLTATTKGKIVGDLTYSYYVNSTAMPDDPSNVKRFVTLTPSGLLRVYVMSKLKRTIVAVEHYSRIVQTSSLGINKRTVTFT